MPERTDKTPAPAQRAGRTLCGFWSWPGTASASFRSRRSRPSFALTQSASDCSRAHRDRPSAGPIRVRARDAVFLDLQAVRYGIEKTNINDVFQLWHAAALYETLYPVAARTTSCTETPMLAAVRDYQQRVRQGVFDRLAVSWLVSDRCEGDPPWPVETSGVLDGGRFVIQRNPTAMPRAYVVPRALVVDDDPAVVLSRFRSSDPRTAVIMAFDPLKNVATDRRCPMTPARWLSRDPDRPVLEVTTVAPGLLVVADTWMSGWRATVDGKPAPIYRGNIAQRVIPLEDPGRHRIVLEYHPPGWKLRLPGDRGLRLLLDRGLRTGSLQPPRLT